MSTENLIQNRVSLTPEERRERASKAGIASGEARRKRRQMRDVLADFMGAEVTEPELIDMLTEVGLPATQEAAICFAAVKRAQHGDIEACRFVRDTLGEKPSFGLEVMDVTERPFDITDLSKLSDEELLARLAECERKMAEME